jgi:hypothetical protein
MSAPHKPLLIARGPLARKVLASMRTLKARAVVDLDAWRAGKRQAEQSLAQARLATPALAELDPVHGLYVFAHNQLAELIEHLIEVPALAKLTDAYAQAQDDYMPGGPPMSPLTTSYFSAWGYCDLVAGAKRESFASVAIDVCRYLNVEPLLLALFETLSQSRLGVYRHAGYAGEHVVLTELVTQRSVTAHSASGYAGQPGELWLVRVLPPPAPALHLGDYAVVFNTPYVLGVLDESGRWSRTPEASWRGYFERTLAKVKANDPTAAYEQLMKYGLSRQYWNEYIFVAYANHRADCIYLAGWPDVPDSLPHSEAGQARWG